MAFLRRGGKRPGCRTQAEEAQKAGVSHRTRAVLASRFPVHVTLRLGEGVAATAEQAIVSRVAGGIPEGQRSVRVSVVSLLGDEQSPAPARGGEGSEGSIAGDAGSGDSDRAGVESAVGADGQGVRRSLSRSGASDAQGGAERVVVCAEQCAEAPTGIAMGDRSVRVGTVVRWLARTTKSWIGPGAMRATHGACSYLASDEGVAAARVDSPAGSTRFRCEGLRGVLGLSTAVDWALSATSRRL